MVSLSDVVAGLGLAVVAGVILAGYLAGGERSRAAALPAESFVLWVVAAMLGGLLLAALAVHRWTRGRSTSGASRRTSER